MNDGRIIATGSDLSSERGIGPGGASSTIDGAHESIPSLAGMQTPALVLDRAILERNLERMRARLKHFNIPLRPHLKTAKSAAVWRLAVVDQPGGITVQTLAEAEYFAGHGCNDILYAVSAVGSKLPRLAALQRSGVTVTIVCDSFEGARGIQSAAVALDASFPVMIEIDSDGARAGMPWNDEQLLPLARQVAAGPGTSLAGVLCHAGSAYDSPKSEDIQRAAETERVAAVSAAGRIRAAGIPCEEVSIGSSPSSAVAEQFDGVTEVRAGVYMFNDLSMVELGLCERSDIAMTVLSTVISHNRSAGTIIIDAGALALSKDLGFAERSHAHYGEIVDALTGEATGLVVNSISQEHGNIDASDEDFDRRPIGSLLRVLPNHACTTAGGFDHYEVIDRGEAVGVWDRCSGW